MAAQLTGRLRWRAMHTIKVNLTSNEWQRIEEEVLRRIRQAIVHQLVAFFQCPHGLATSVGSAFRHCGRDPAEFFKSAEWPLYVHVGNFALLSYLRTRE